MSALTFKITGDKLIDLRLQRLPKAVQRRVVQRAIRPAAEQLKAQAAAGAPRDTGRLALAHRIKRFAKRGRIGYRVGTFGKGRGRGYARVVELGSRKRRITGSRHLRRPFYASRNRIARDCRRQLIAALRQRGH